LEYNIRMTYFGVLLAFVVPPLLALAVWVPRDFWRWLFRRAPRADWLPYKAILLLVLIALVYTTPWDNYLVATGVWWYDPALVTGVTIGWVPIEEYTFFILQTLLTGLWTVLLLRKVKPAPAQSGSRLNRWSGVMVTLLWASALGLWLSGWQPGVYLSLTLAWALVPLLLQAGFGADILWANRRAYLLSAGIPTLYLWGVDALAITSGTWTIDPRQTTGLVVGPLPVEEMLFFLATNVIVAGGVMLLLSP
jgi:putative membrane protein